MIQKKGLAVTTGFLLMVLFEPVEHADARVEDRDIRNLHSFAQNRLETARTGTTSTWSNPATGASGTFVITATDDRTGSQPCRAYRWTIESVDGEIIDGRGQGCRQGVADWRLDESRTTRQARRPDPEPRRPVARAEPKPEPAEKEEPAEETAAVEKSPADALAKITFQVPPRTVFNDATGIVAE
ncbi:MAG: RT0821/Lpp0805 family surface protein [Pseudomonadota bacterium]